LLGTVVNTIAIVAGSLAGLLFRGGIPARYSETVFHSVGLAVILVGLRGALKADNLLLVIASLAVGSLAGELCRIEAHLEHLGAWIGRRLAMGQEGVAQGFVTASLVYCVGAMAVVGSLESGLAGNHQTLFAKSILDGITAIIFASTLGVGVIFSAVSVLLYQGAITMAASYLKPLLVPTVVAEMSAVGGLLIVAIGFNILEIKKTRVGNMLPAIFVPLVVFALQRLWQGW
jgi:uncharacterized membrane protein YqgA involved in biofilm formation